MRSMLAIVGVGSNLGPRDTTIAQARAMLDSDEEIVVEAMSPFYETEPLGPPQPRYLNAALRVRTELSPVALLDALLGVERALGRLRDPGLRWGPRTIDLDLLWCDHGEVRFPRLTVPHPELEKRAFALAPLLDVAPELMPRYSERLVALGGAPPRYNP